MTGIRRQLRTVRNRRYPLRVNAETGKEIDRGASSSFAKREVVLGGAAFVAVTFRHDPHMGRLLQNLRVVLQRSLGIGNERVLIVIEIDYLEIGLNRLKFLFRDRSRSMGSGESRMRRVGFDDLLGAPRGQGAE